MIFEKLFIELEEQVKEWSKRFEQLDKDCITQFRNNQNRSIKQVVGHMVDSVSNNTHRVIHLQYQQAPVEFPNYATYGNNDRWIAIQNYQNEDWNILIRTWEYLHLHFIHVIKNIDRKKLGNQWVADKNKLISLKDMIEDFPRHFQLHIKQIEELINQSEK